MTELSSTPRRHRSSFRAPAPGSVDPSTLHRVFGEASGDDEPRHRAEAPRNRRDAERAAAHLAERVARAGHHAPARAAARPEQPATGFDALISPEAPSAAAVDVDASSTPAEPAGAALPPPTEPIAISATDEPRRDEPRAWWLERKPVVTGAPDATREPQVLGEPEATREAGRGDELGARGLLAALDPDGLLEPDRVLGSEHASETPLAPSRAFDVTPSSAPARASTPTPTPPSTPAWTRLLADRRIVLAAAATAVLAAGGLGLGALASGSFSSSSPGGTSSSESSESRVAGDAVEAAPTATITGDLSETAAPVSGGTSVSVAGEHLDEVARVSVGGAEAAIVDATADRLTFTVPPAADDAPGEVPVVFSDAQGNAATAGAGSLTLTYTPDSGVEAQLAYVGEHWDAYNPDYPTLPGQDSVNFASQSLVARGWAMDDDWNADGETGTMSAAWSGSTALRDYLRTRTDQATELTDAQRSEVKPGDIAQFDWDDSGDRDFTAVVTRVEHTDAGSKVWITAHSNDVEAWDVDSALRSGGTVTYFSIR